MNQELDALLKKIMFAEFRGGYTPTQEAKLIKGLATLIKNVEIRPQLLADMFEETD